MSTLFTPPRYAPVDGNGNTYPGGLLYFYITGTTTPLNVYADAGLTTPLSNPVVADGNGLFPAIYLGEGDYKIILKTAADVTAWTVDPYSGSTALNTLTTRGDLLTRDASGYKRLPIGIAGQQLTSDGVDAVWRDANTPYLYIYQLTYAPAVADPSNDISVVFGGAMDETGVRFLVLSPGITKKLDAAWAVGDNQGGLDTGSVADGNYYIWLINRPDTGVTDVLFSASSSTPAMPANYTLKRLIGWFKRASGAIVPFKTYETAGGGIEFAWVTPRRDVNLASTLTTSRRTDVLSIPTTISVVAHIRALAANSAAGSAVVVCNPDEADAAPSLTNTPLVSLYVATAEAVAEDLFVRTSTGGEVASQASGLIELYIIVTLGFIWGRRG